MPRKAKGKHTCPENAGEQNITPEMIESAKADDLNALLLHKTQILKANRIDYKGQWTDEQFDEYVSRFFSFCNENKLEPSRAYLQLWLGVGDRQFHRWLNDPNYGVKCQILEMALKEMEALYFAKLDSRPVPSMFKLKSKHGYVESQKIEVLADAKVSADEIKDKIAGMFNE